MLTTVDRDQESVTVVSKGTAMSLPDCPPDRPPDRPRLNIPVNEMTSIRGKGSFPKRHRKVANEIDGRVEGYRKIIKEGDCRKYGED